MLIVTADGGLNVISRPKENSVDALRIIGVNMFSELDMHP